MNSAVGAYSGHLIVSVRTLLWALLQGNTQITNEPTQSGPIEAL
ncbi:hypothetical protein AB0F46_03840 [Streptomyces sp. NPDC026665]